MADIHELKTPPKQRNEATITLLREMLADAEAGNVESVMVIGFDGRGAAKCAFSPGTEPAYKIGLLELLKADIIAEILGVIRVGGR